MPSPYASVASRDEQELVEGSRKGKRTPKSNWRDIALVQEYTLIKQVGKGGFSEIWLGEHKESGQQVAVKVVNLRMEDLEDSEIANLIAEAKFLRTMDCPFLVKCLDMTHDDQWLVLVLEYLAGGEMLAHLHKVKKYTEVEAAKLFAQVVSAISYLHNLNLMHRDIKPENVMFTHPVEAFEAEGRPLRVKVIDMGMSALYDPSKEIRGCIGTCGFVAPEIWNDAPHTPAGDVYALGVMLFIMLTGRTPHSGLDIRTMAYCNKRLSEAAGLRDERYLNLSAEAKDLLLKMLADDPKARPTCLEVLKHPFITADESNAAAHREMGDLVRNRMRDLVRIRRMHGLQYALRMAKKDGADKQALLNALEQRRLKLAANGAGFFSRASQNSLSGAAASPFGRTSMGPDGPAFTRTSAGPATPEHPRVSAGGAIPSFARASAGPAMATYPRGSGGIPPVPAFARASAGLVKPSHHIVTPGIAASPSRTAPGGPGGTGSLHARMSGTGASPFARSSLAQSYAIELPQALAMVGSTAVGGWMNSMRVSGGGSNRGGRSSGGGVNGSSPIGVSANTCSASEMDIRLADSPRPANQGSVLVLPVARPPPVSSAGSGGSSSWQYSPASLQPRGPGQPVPLSALQLAAAVKGPEPCAAPNPLDSTCERGFAQPPMSAPNTEPSLPVMARSLSGVAPACEEGSAGAATGDLGDTSLLAMGPATPPPVSLGGEAQPRWWPPACEGPPAYRMPVGAQQDASVQVLAAGPAGRRAQTKADRTPSCSDALPPLSDQDESPRGFDFGHQARQHHHCHHVSADPLSLLNVLPSALQRSATMPAADSPWVPGIDLEAAELRRCLSVNQTMLDMMRHADVMTQVHVAP